MTDPTTAEAGDLHGTADEWIHQLAEAEPEQVQSAEWLHRQLQRALLAWATDETQVDINRESHVDY